MTSAKTKEVYSAVADPFSSKKDRCVKCDGLGYDYIVYDKRRAL